MSKKGIPAKPTSNAQSTLGDGLPREQILSIIETDAQFRVELAKLARASIENLDQIESTGSKVLGPIGELWAISRSLLRSKRELYEELWKVENVAAVIVRVNDLCKELGIDTEDLQPLPPKVAIQFKEGIAQEDDPDLREWWAKLIVRAADPASDFTPQIIFKDLLQNLSPGDATYFEDIYLLVQGRNFRYDYRAGKLALYEIDAIEYEKDPDRLTRFKYENPCFVSKNSFEEAELALSRLEIAGLLSRQFAGEELTTSVWGELFDTQDSEGTRYSESVSGERLNRIFTEMLRSLGSLQISPVGLNLAEVVISNK